MLRPLKIIFEILHPAHLYFFSKTFQELQKRNIPFLICTRDKDITASLCKELNLEHLLLSKRRSGPLALYWEGIERAFKLYRISKQTSPSLLVGVMGLTLTPVAKLLKIPSLVFYDTETAKFSNLISFRLATCVCITSSYQGKLFPNSVLYPSYQCLAGLYAKGDLFLKNKSSQPEGKPQILFRFVKRNSIHELLEKNISWKVRQDWVNSIPPHYSIQISSEVPLPEPFKKYEYSGKKSDFHFLLKKASLIISESPTVCAEAACLGVPSFYLSPSPRGYLSEIEKKYGLVRSIEKNEILALQNAMTSNTWKNWFPIPFEIGHENLLKDKINPNPFILEQIIRLLQ